MAHSEQMGDMAETEQMVELRHSPNKWEMAQPA